MDKQALLEALYSAEYTHSSVVDYSEIVAAMLDVLDSCPENMTVAELKLKLKNVDKD